MSLIEIHNEALFILCSDQQRPWPSTDPVSTSTVSSLHCTNDLDPECQGHEKKRILSAMATQH